MRKKSKSNQAIWVLSNLPQRRRSHRERKTRRQGEGETRRKRQEEDDFLLSLSPCPLVPLSASAPAKPLWHGQKNQAGRSSEKLALPAFPVGECCSAYSSSATLKLICGTRYCPLTNRSVWSFSTPAASVFNSDSRSSLYFPFAKSNIYTGPPLF